jgi:hypothetical protein
VLEWSRSRERYERQGLLVVTAKVEERENFRFFGPIYEAYMRQTKRFIPFLLLTRRPMKIITALLRG